jgi:hypothetical protein
MAKVRQQARLESMVTSTLIHAVFYFMDLKPVVSGHFLQIFKDQQVQLARAARMERMATMARMVLMERQLPMHQQQLRRDLLAHKEKKEQPVQLDRQDLQGQPVQQVHKVQLVLQDREAELQDLKVRPAHKELLVQQVVLVQQGLLDPLEQRVQQEVQELPVLLEQPVQRDLREFQR